MAFDEHHAARAFPMVRLFTWNPSAISLGLKQSLPDWLDEITCLMAGLDMVERPTGGGIAFHGSDVSIALVEPLTPLPLHELMRAMCQSAVDLCREYGLEADVLLEVAGRERILYCLGQQSSYAIYVKRRKVAGFAIRRFPHAWLIQGSLLVGEFSAALNGVLPISVRAQLGRCAISLSEAVGQTLELQDVAGRWATCWFVGDAERKSVAVPN